MRRRPATGETGPHVVVDATMLLHEHFTPEQWASWMELVIDAIESVVDEGSGAVERCRNGAHGSAARRRGIRETPDQRVLRR
jgi:hypothetical protein